MKKIVPFNELLEIIRRFPTGASLEEILLSLPAPIPLRSLQRFVSMLVKEGKLIAIGQARARRYQIPEPLASTSKQESPIPLSPEGISIAAYVDQPIQRRTPTTYHKEFLENYIPNQTFYLPEDLRKKLAMIGGGNYDNYPMGTYARQIFHRLLIDLSWNSSRLEGNTYSLLETERLLDLGKAATGKDLKETQMILNHKAAIEFLIDSSTEIGVNRYTILSLHTLLSDNLLGDSSASGRLRIHPVGIEQSVYIPSAIPQLIEECFALLILKAGLIEDPFEQTFFLMVQLPYLQSFDDVNKRTSRLAANIPLIQKNLCPLSFIDVPLNIYVNGLLGIYELNRIELLRDLFEWAYERSSSLYSVARKSLGEPDPFRLYYREAIFEVVTSVILNKMDRALAAKSIREWAKNQIKEPDQMKFTETVERELQSLHEGNIARYRIRPTQYLEWKAFWS